MISIVQRLRKMGHIFGEDLPAEAADHIEKLERLNLEVKMAYEAALHRVRELELVIADKEKSNG